MHYAWIDSKNKHKPIVQKHTLNCLNLERLRICIVHYLPYTYITIMSNNREKQESANIKEFLRKKEKKQTDNHLNRETFIQKYNTYTLFL